LDGPGEFSEFVDSAEIREPAFRSTFRAVEQIGQDPGSVSPAAGQLGERLRIAFVEGLPDLGISDLYPVPVDFNPPGAFDSPGGDGLGR
jgi:hypothetical protein